MRGTSAPTARLLSVDEFAAVAGVSRATVERLIGQGELHITRFGRIRRIDVRELDRLVAEGGVRRIGGRLERRTVPAE